MDNLVFLGLVGLFSGFYLLWGFRRLPREEWQMLASLPVSRGENGNWRGINLTYYGLLTANAYLAAVAMALILLASAGIALADIVSLVALLLLCCVPASRWVAQLVERKAHTFTVGGAVFVGIVAAPCLVGLVNVLPWRDGAAAIPVLPCLAAISVAYCYGEGLGRLACISFGCCYGKPLKDCHPLLRRLFSRWNFIFVGKTKKIAYAGGLEGEKVLPVQALTSVLYVFCGLVSAGLFLASRFAAAFLLATTLTQLWRVLSEFLRADYRGAGKITAYQFFGLAGWLYAVWITPMFSGTAAVNQNLASGLRYFWDPGVFMSMQAIWLLLFVYTGRSSVTGSELCFHVHEGRI